MTAVADYTMPTFAGDIRLTSNITVDCVRAFADDAWIEEAARTSTQAEIKDLAKHNRPTGGLIRKLMAERHGTPFEFGGWFVFRVHAPIMVFREWHRHRIAWSYNEQSGRYTEFAPVFYTPHPGRPMVQVGKPMDYAFEHGSGFQHGLAEQQYASACAQAWESYQAMLDGGICREVARGVLPVTTFSTMYAAANPRTLMHFLSLRTEDVSAAYASHPMWEIHHGCARRIEAVLNDHLPVTAKAWHENGRVAP